MAELRLNNVSKVFDKNIWAVRNITLAVKEQEFCILLGPSGCGKTTILRLIAGLEKPDAGEIYIDDNLINDFPPDKRDVAMVFQNYALYPHMSVYENMAFGLRMRKYPLADIEPRVREAAQVLGISHLLRRKPRQLSGGERQRVALGRALVRQPKIFLFDEPLSNLDAKLRIQMRIEIARLREQIHSPVVYVTHDQIEAMTLGDQIAVMKDGAIQQISDSATLYEHPINRFVAGFIGTPPMNFIPGNIIRDHDQVRFQAEEVILDLKAEHGRHAGRAVIIGIRPSDFFTPGSPLKIKVDAIEPLGTEKYLSGRLGAYTVQARLPDGLKAQRGETIPLTVNPDKIYLFDGETDSTLD